MSMFDTNFKNRIDQWDKSLNWDKTTKSPIHIKLIKTNHVEDTQFINFANNFTNIASHCKIEIEQTNAELPGFALTENIIFSALPLEKELDPFLDALSAISTTDLNLSESLKRQLAKIDIPVNLTLFIALQCPHCPDVVKTVIPLALYCKNIKLHIIDGSLFPPMSQKFKIMSAPCLILEEDFRWTGSVSDKEIVRMIIDRDPSKLSADTLKTILEDGDASWISKQMMEKQTLFDGFIDLVLHETWSVRLGTMVVVEELAETDSTLALTLCPILISYFDNQGITVQGDILYALGEAGNDETKNWITQKLPSMEHPDLIEAAQDAIESLELK
jgi:thioredoxin family protein